MTKSWPIKCNHPVVLCSQINQTAGLKVLDHAAVAMKQDQRGSCPSLHVMQTDTLHRNKSTPGRIAAFSLLGQPMIQKSRPGSSGHYTSSDNDGLLRP